MVENISVNLPERHSHKYISRSSADETEDYPNELTIKVIRDAERGKNMYGPFDTVAEVMEALNAED